MQSREIAGFDVGMVTAEIPHQQHEHAGPFRGFAQQLKRLSDRPLLSKPVERDA
jgi:hypothetical protein